ncbi:MAG: hypothetical protein ACLGHC_09610 [Alphaproteobacteria bacterium]
MLGRLILLIAAVVLYAGAAHAEWQQAKTKHFIIYADADSDELREYATKLETFDQAVRIARKMPDPPLTDAGRLTIYTFKDVPALNRLLNTGRAIYGIYFSRASGSLAFVARHKPQGPGEMNPDNVFFHEYAHHLMLQGLGIYYPPWLVEGFAELLSTAEIGANGSVILGAAANHRSAGIFAPDRDFPVSAMVGDTTRSLDGWQRELLYSRGWLLTHYLTFEPSRKGQLDRYVEGIRSGKPPVESAKNAFGDLLKLGRDLDAYARRKTLSGTIIQTDQSKIGSIDIRPLTPPEEAILPVRMRSDFGVSPATARWVAGRARNVARRFPDSPVVQAALAEAEYDARDYTAAIAAADRALSANPNNVAALIYRGRALMALAKENPSSADWQGIRNWFVRANHADPENPEPLMRFYQTYKEAGATPPAGAVKGLLYALVLAPQDNNLRLMAVRQLLIDQKLPEARESFAPLAFDPHARDFRDTAKSVLQAIEASEPARAVALIDAWEDKHGDED